MSLKYWKEKNKKIKTTTVILYSAKRSFKNDKIKNPPFLINIKQTKKIFNSDAML